MGECKFCDVKYCSEKVDKNPMRERFFFSKSDVAREPHAVPVLKYDEEDNCKIYDLLLRSRFDNIM
jgi:hypothetical protein